MKDFFIELMNLSLCYDVAPRFPIKTTNNPQFPDEGQGPNDSVSWANFIAVQCSCTMRFKRFLIDVKICHMETPYQMKVHQLDVHITSEISSYW